VQPAGGLVPVTRVEILKSSAIMKDPERLDEREVLLPLFRMARAAQLDSHAREIAAQELED
jgi:hypothetical protein